jgi:aminoglycoside 6'-N-acetyltransferase I
MKVEIVRLTAENIAMLDRIAMDVFDEKIDAKRLAAYVGEPGHFMIVARVNDEVVGQVAAVIHRHPDKPTELYIDEIGVTPRLHRHGIARQMMDAMFALGKSVGCKEAWVGTEPDNLAARALYESYQASGEPCVIYLYDL